MNMVRVQLMRNVHATSYGSQVRRTFATGDCELYALPPRPKGLKTGSSIDGNEILEWEGSVRCGGEVNMGGFVVDDALSIIVSDQVLHFH